MPSEHRAGPTQQNLGSVPVTQILVLSPSAHRAAVSALSVHLHPRSGGRPAALLHGGRGDAGAAAGGPGHPAGGVGEPPESAGPEDGAD